MSNNFNGWTRPNLINLSYHVGGLREANCYPSFSVGLQSEVEHVAFFAACVDSHKNLTGVLTLSMSASTGNLMAPPIGGDIRLWWVKVHEQPLCLFPGYVTP